MPLNLEGDLFDRLDHSFGLQFGEDMGAPEMEAPAATHTSPTISSPRSELGNQFKAYAPMTYAMVQEQLEAAEAAALKAAEIARTRGGTATASFASIGPAFTSNN